MAEDLRQKVQYEMEMAGLDKTGSDLGNIAAQADKAAQGTDKHTRSMRDAQQSVGALERDLKKLVLQYFSIQAAVAAIRAGVEFMRGSVEIAINEIESANKFVVVFGESAEATDARLRAMADSTNRAFSDLRTGASGLQDMLVPMGIARDEAAELSVSFVELANDLSSFNNVETAQVLEAMRSALAGQSEPMRNFGVDLRQASINAELFRMGITEGTAAATEAEKAQAILNIMYRQSADALGDAERTADSAANQIRGLNADVLTFRQELGEAFIPMLETLIPEMRDGFATLGPEVVERVKDMTWALNEFMEVGRDVADFQSQTSFPVWKEYNDLVGYAWVPTEALLDLWRRWRTDAEEADNALGNLDNTIAQHNAIIESLNLKQIEATVGAYDFALAQLAILSATSGLDLALQGQITRIEQMRASMQLAREEAKGDVTLGRVNRTVPEVPAYTYSGGRSTSADNTDVTDPKTGGITKADAMAREIADAMAMQEEYMDSLYEFRASKEAEFQEMVLAQEQVAWESRYEIGMHYAGMMSSMLASEFENGFKDIDKAFGKLAARMMSELVASGLLSWASSLLGGGPVGIFGQIFGGGK